MQEHDGPVHKSRRMLSCILVGVAVLLVTCAVVLGVDEDPPKRREVILGNGTAPPCSSTHYAMHGLCYSCEDCVSGQMCAVHGGDSGCHDCPAGRYDDDFDAMTNCVDCPSGQLSSPQATGCEEPDDFWDKLLVPLTAAVGVVAAVGGALAGLTELNCCKHDASGKYRSIERESEQ